MTVHAILEAKGHQILSIEPDVKLSAAIKIGSPNGTSVPSS